MKVAQDILSRVVVQKHPNDKTLSYTGQGDFVDPEPEIVTYPARPVAMRPRTKASQNNSYT